MGISLPEITNEDIAWAVKTLGLPNDAFSPEKDGGAREKILKSVGETVDVSACPGSGKTTLLVAKLAILARKWSSRRQGICVLSHTNVAKDEIEKRLGGTEVGQALLSYPHYIGTIHGFVNEFLSLPWLRSKGYPVIAIDDDIVKKHRVSCLDGWTYPQLKGWIKHQRESIPDIVNSWVVSSPKFDVSDKKGSPIFKGDGKSKVQLSELAKQVVMRGYHRHDEMFTWAHDLIDTSPSAVKYICDRFPLLFIDEVQDNSEVQSFLLHRIFSEGEGVVCRMRLGDNDQEIFDHAGVTNKAKTDPFPSEVGEQAYDLPNSHRFGQSIADLASPLSVSKACLVGQGPNDGLDKDGDHAIFLVENDSVGSVLNIYGQYLLSVFDEEQDELDGMTFTAVGAVHRDKEGAEDKKPHNISHYYDEYDPDIANKDPKPNTFLQYVTAGHRLGEKFASEGTGGESFAAVERVAMGLIQLVKDVSTQLDVRPRKRNHRFLIELLENDKGNFDNYLKLVSTFAVNRSFPSEVDWNGTWKKIVIDIVASLSEVFPKDDHPFLGYPQLEENAFDHHKKRRNNTYTVEHGGRAVNIQLGSIHSVKGETHTATLVLETYFNSHHLNTISPWIKSKPKRKVKDSLGKRLKLHYVAMTRPSHLLCLAMKKSTFVDKKTGEIDTEKLEELINHGWGKIGIVKSNGACEWLKVKNISSAATGDNIKKYLEELKADFPKGTIFTYMGKHQVKLDSLSILKNAKGNYQIQLWSEDGKGYKFDSLILK